MKPFHVPALIGIVISLLMGIISIFIELISPLKQIYTVAGLTILLLSFGISNYMRVLVQGSVYDRKHQK